MRFKLADDLQLRPREWSILRYLLWQFPNGHLFEEAFYKLVSLTSIDRLDVLYIRPWNASILSRSWVQMKNMSIYQNHTKGLSCWVSKKLLLSWFVKLLAYGGTDLVQMAVSEMCNSAILIKSSVAIGCNYLFSKTSFNNFRLRSWRLFC